MITKASNPFWQSSLTVDESQWHWAKQPSGSISLPDFIQLRAKSEAKMANGHVYLKEPGPDPELTALFKKRMNNATKAMNEAFTKNLYEGNQQLKGLAGLLKDE